MGGPKREFFCLVASDIKEKYFHGREHYKTYKLFKSVILVGISIFLGKGLLQHWQCQSVKMAMAYHLWHHKCTIILCNLQCTKIHVEKEDIPGTLLQSIHENVSIYFC